MSLVQNTGSTNAAFGIASDAQILMSDFTYKPIKDLERGDFVWDYEGFTHQIARVIRNVCPHNYRIDLVKIEKDALGNNLPTRDTLISGQHPIWYQGLFRVASSLIGVTGVTHWYHTVLANEILPLDEKCDDCLDCHDDHDDKPKCRACEEAETLRRMGDTYSVYNLQFDHQGVFIANGLVVQSLSHKNESAMLSEDLFFK